MRTLLFCSLLILGCSNSPPERPAANSPQLGDEPEISVKLEVENDNSQAVLVELFTSQGCSSCPPADKLLTNISSISDREVIALAYHVDYWNYIGWSDPYSSAQWSSRQRGYAKAIAGGRNYTPQLVVSGREHVVGSRKNDVKAAIDAQSKQKASTVALRVVGEPSDNDELRLQIEVEIGKGESGAQLFVAVYENDLETSVLSGENAGRKLRNDRVVRSLEMVTALGGGRTTKQVGVEVQDDWVRENIGVVVFVQDVQSLEIYAAKEVLP